MKVHEPSRILNETRLGILGLTVHDFLLLVGVYGGLQLFLSAIFGPTILPMLILLFIALVLILVRHIYRRHVIRDYLSYTLNKLLNLGLWYDKTY